MAQFQSLAQRLYQTDLEELEVTSIVVFYRKQGHDWPVALAKTWQLKNLPPGTLIPEKCRVLANEIIA